MSGKLFGRALFGYKKSNVNYYIEKLDSEFSARLQEKEQEIENLETKLRDITIEHDKLQANREMVLEVLENAQKSANRIVNDAKADAARMRAEAAEEIEELKSRANREIEIKRREIRSYYAQEAQKINSLRGEIYAIRKQSLDAIKKFEENLSKYETELSGETSYVEATIEENKKASPVEPFKEVIKKIPIRVIRTNKPDRKIQ
ncbi:MAG: DivIVA domain-containing protein [Clostridia bacterium]|nr:DivIVA domain-containing protein [Clostridia bacterium]